MGNNTYTTNPIPNNYYYCVSSYNGKGKRYYFKSKFCALKMCINFLKENKEVIINEKNNK